MIAILADAFVKATVLLVLAAVVTVFLRRSPASLRHLVWTLACGGVLALPLASALLPNWRLARRRCCPTGDSPPGHASMCRWRSMPSKSLRKRRNRTRSRRRPSYRPPMRPFRQHPPPEKQSRFGGA